MTLSKSEPKVAPAPGLPVPRRIGRFDVLGRLATGGMADVFICCERGMAGLERLVVIKQILPHLAVHPTFVEMFLAEARYVARLNHPNVVQIFELGEDTAKESGAMPYLAMEYVAGSSLRDVIIESIEQMAVPPVGAAVGLLAQACAGAHAAHELADINGRPLGLVHRDISPHNLMVTAEGHVKLLDFGIAKATEAVELDDLTSTGALKGKVHYMAPEQCRQEPLDRRADVFALGIVLWELLAKQRLFKRDSDLDSMQAIVNGDVRDLASIRPDIPRPIVDALARALRRDRNERYPTALDMRRGLVDACAEANIRCDLDAVAAFVKPLVGEQHAQRRTALLALAQDRTQATPAGSIDNTRATLVDKRRRPGAEGTPAVQGPSLELSARDRPSREPTVPGAGPSNAAVAAPATMQRRGRAVLAAGLAVLVAAVGAFFVHTLAGGPTGPVLRVAFPGTAGGELVLADLDPLDAHLERTLERPVEFIVGSSYDELLSWFVDGRVAVAVFPPNTYLQAKGRMPGLQLLAQKVIDGASGSDGVLVVVESSPASSLADLRGKRVCFADPLSTTGYILARKALRAAGVNPDVDIVSHISGNHIQVLRDVVEGVCEAGATYSGGYLAADRAGVPVARVRQLALTGRSPQDAVCARSDLPAEERERIRAALLAYAPAEGNSRARVERISGFAAVSDRDYEAVRDLSVPPR